MDEIIEILNQIKPGVDFENESNLIKDGILTSLEIIMLVSELEDRFDIEIGLTNVVPENFSSASAIAELVERIQEES